MSLYALNLFDLADNDDYLAYSKHSVAAVGKYGGQVAALGYRGSDLLGHLFDLALARAYDKGRPPLVAVADPPGLRGAPAALTSTFQRMRELEGKSTPRLGIVQMGASHTSAHYFSGTPANRRPSA